MSPPQDPSERAGKRRRLVLRKLEPEGEPARPSLQPPMPSMPSPMRPRLPSVSFRPGSGIADGTSAEGGVVRREDVPSRALPLSEGPPTLRRPLTGVSAITASAAASAHTPTPGMPPSEVHRISRNQTRSSLPPVVARSAQSQPYPPPPPSPSFPPGYGEADGMAAEGGVVKRGDLPSASTRAALIGAALGLAIVAGLVIVARARVPSKTGSATAVAAEPQGLPRSTGTPFRPGSGEGDGTSAGDGVVKPGDMHSSPRPHAADATPGHTAGNSSIVATTLQHLRNDVALPPPLAVHSAPATQAPKARTPLYRAPPPTPKSVGIAGAAPAAATSEMSKAGANDETPQDDGASSLVPVIPQSAPPPADPLIQAVQHDIEEEEHAKAK